MLGKVKEVGERPTTGVVLEAPVPLRAMVRPETAGEVVIVTDPVRVPVVAGLNVTLIVQFVPAVRLEPQLFVWTKSLLLAPSMAILEMLKA